MHARRYRLLAISSAAFLFAATACGGDDQGTATTATPVTTIAPATTVTPPATTAPTTDTPPTTTTVAEEPEDRPVIMATTTIWGDVVRQVTCDGLAEVTVLIPAGGDAHSFEPSFRDRATMSSAALIVANGLNLEEQLVATIEAVESEGVPVFRVADHVDDLLEFGDGKADDDHSHDHNDDHSHDHNDDHSHDDDDDHGHSHGPEDPHLWFDPVRVASALPALGEVLIQTAGLDADAVQGCVEAYQAELADAAAAMAEELARVPADRRLLVTSHESLGYFADRFGFDIVGTVIQGTSSLAETNPAALESLASEIIATGVPAIFANAEASTADIDALATRLGGVQVVPLQTESLGPPGSGTDTYLGFLSATASTVADALSV